MILQFIYVCSLSLLIRFSTIEGQLNGLQFFCRRIIKRNNLFSASNAELTIPFITSYPFVSTKDLDSDEYDPGNGFFVQYLLKTQPLSRGDYSLAFQPADNNVKV